MEYPLAVGDFLDRAVTVYASVSPWWTNPIACGPVALLTLPYVPCRVLSSVRCGAGGDRLALPSFVSRRGERLDRCGRHCLDDGFLVETLVEGSYRVEHRKDGLGE